MKVHVVAWEYYVGAPHVMEVGGGGFNWYHTPESADKAFELEKGNCRDFSDQKWTAFRFDVDVTEGLDADGITAEIDDNIYALTAAAPIKYMVVTQEAPAC